MNFTLGTDFGLGQANSSAAPAPPKLYTTCKGVGQPAAKGSGYAPHGLPDCSKHLNQDYDAKPVECEAVGFNPRVGKVPLGMKSASWYSYEFKLPPKALA